MSLNKKISTEYLRTKIESATAIGRVLILCEACLKFLAQSKEALTRGDKLTFVDRNIRAQNIIRELRNSLNLDVDEKLAGGFYSIYNFMLKQLMQTIRTKKVEPIDKVMKMLGSLYQAWKTAEEKGLGGDVKRVEERRGDRDSIYSRVTTAKKKSYSALNEGLNFIS